MDKIEQLAKTAIEARELLRRIGAGTENQYQLPNTIASMVRTINSALVPFVGVGASPANTQFDPAKPF